MSSRKKRRAISPSEPSDAKRRTGLSPAKKILFSLLVLVVFFGTIELALRLVGFEIKASVDQMEFSFPIDDYNKSAPQRFLERDPVLFWKPIAGAIGHNSHGLLGPEFGDKQKGVYRIVCLGDSCTHFGPGPYPELLAEYLEEQFPGKFEVINASCIGYSSFQGMQMLQHKALSWDPDLVTVYFGWNDHWLAKGRADKDQLVSSASFPGHEVLSQLRLFQLFRLLKPQATQSSSELMRVSLDDYRSNLNSMEALCDAQDVETLYFTAPHALDLGIPPYLHSSGEITDPQSLIPLHESYNSIVREVAAKQQSALIDLELEVNQVDKGGLFIEDHIHLSEAGRLYVTKRIIETLKERGVLPSSMAVGEVE